MGCETADGWLLYLSGLVITRSRVKLNIDQIKKAGWNEKVFCSRSIRPTPSTTARISSAHPQLPGDTPSFVFLQRFHPFAIRKHLILVGGSISDPQVSINLVCFPFLLKT